MRLVSTIELLLLLWLLKAPAIILGSCGLIWAARDERHPMAVAVCWGLAWSLGASISHVMTR